MTNLHKLPILNTAKNLTYHIPFSSQRGKMQFKFFSPVRGSVTKWWGVAQKNFSKNSIYINIMSFWHQKIKKPYSSSIKTLKISQNSHIQWISLNKWIFRQQPPHFTKIHYFTESVKKFAKYFFWIIIIKIHYFIE